MAIEIPEIIRCDAKICVYNGHGKCYGGFIVVKGPYPMCASFIKGSFADAEEEIPGVVYACNMTDCRFNDGLMCVSPGTIFEWDGRRPLCVLFKNK